MGAAWARGGGMGATWERRAGGVEAAWRRRAAALRRRGGGVEAQCSGVARVGAAWGLHLNGRSMYSTYFGLVDVYVFVLVDEPLIWYSCTHRCMYLIMSLLQHLFAPLSRIIFRF